MSLSVVRELYLERYGSEPEIVAVAPGRINLIGEHTDYNDGFVFPVAIDRQTWVAVSRTRDHTNLYSAQAGQAQGFSANLVEPNNVNGWAKYPAGMAWALRTAGYEPCNVQGVVTSNIPMGSGVSSSAALEMAFGAMWRQYGQFSVDGPALALLGQQCENKFVGVNSGIMDQMASAMGKNGQAMYLDTRSLVIDYAPIPESVGIVLLDTKKPRALTSSAYNERRTQCEEAAKILGVPSLRDAHLAMLERARPDMPEVVYRRARHVVTENSRTTEFKLSLDDGDLENAGRLMKESHMSLKDDYEVSCRELDLMAEAAWSAPGCVGARMTGAGFGGACVALVESEKVDSFIAIVITEYDRISDLKGEALSCRAVQGARIEADFRSGCAD
jgi:galactokinase